MAFIPAYATVNIYALNGNHSRLSDKIKSVNKGLDFEFLMYSIMEAQLGDAVSDVKCNDCTESQLIEGFVSEKQ